MKAQKKQPELRFKGFTDDWEQRELKTNVETIGTGKSSFTSNLEESPSRPYAVLGSTSVISYSEEFDYVGNFVLTARVGANAGNLFKYSGNVKITDNTVYIQTENFNFIFYLLSKYNLNRLSFGTGQPLIKASELKKLKLNLPVESKEQKKIGEFFQELDHTITLQQRRLDLLKKLKQGYLQQMFPNKEHPTPQLRFTSFDGDWEHHKLGEVANRFDNLRLPITASKRVSGDTPYYGANGIQDHVKGYTHNGEFILVAEDGASNLNNYPIQYTTGKIWVNNHAHVLQGKENEVDTRFLMHSLKKVKINSFLVGGGRAKLNADIMMKLEINIPLENEQKQISKFFQNIDQAITLEKNKIEQLQQLKQAYLQKLFP